MEKLVQHREHTSTTLLIGDLHHQVGKTGNYKRLKAKRLFSSTSETEITCSNINCVVKLWMHIFKTNNITKDIYKNLVWLCASLKEETLKILTINPVHYERMSRYKLCLYFSFIVHNYCALFITFGGMLIATRACARLYKRTSVFFLLPPFHFSLFPAWLCDAPLSQDPRQGFVHVEGPFTGAVVHLQIPH